MPQNPADKAAHLKEHQFGHNGKVNPGGRPQLSPELKAIKQYNLFELKRHISKLFRMTPEALKDIINNPMTPVIEIIIARTIQTSIKTGDIYKAEILFNRLFGKVAERIQFKALDGMTKEEKIEAGKQALALLEAKREERSDVPTEDQKALDAEFEDL
jgi:hypothetical protein